MMKRITLLAAMSLSLSAFGQEACQGECTEDVTEGISLDASVNATAQNTTATTLLQTMVTTATSNGFTLLKTALCGLIPNAAACDVLEIVLSAINSALAPVENTLISKMSTETAEVVLKISQYNAIAQALSKIEGFVALGEEDIAEGIAKISDPATKTAVQTIVKAAKTYVETGVCKLVAAVENAEHKIMHCIESDVGSIKLNATTVVPALVAEVGKVEAEGKKLGEEVEAEGKSIGDKIKEGFDNFFNDIKKKFTPHSNKTATTLANSNKTATATTTATVASATTTAAATETVASATPTATAAEHN